MSEFYVGQRVICIDASPRVHPHTLECGKEYIVRWLGVYEFNAGVRDSLRVRGIINNSLPHGTYQDIPFEIIRFRPLESKAISLFRQIAKDVTEGNKVLIS